VSSDFSDALAGAISNHAVLPEFEAELSLDEAYRLQFAVAQKRARGGIGGIKAGVTAAALQAFFEIDHALIGRLYSDSRLASGCSFPHLEGRTLECEVAIIVDGEGRPKAIAPAIEIVLLRFARPADASAANLVACNLGADAYIVGNLVPWDPSFNEASVELRRGEEVLNRAALKDALGGPEQGARWIAREAKQRGFECEDDALFLGGACGSVVSAEVGPYTADYGRLGTIEFEIH